MKPRVSPSFAALRYTSRVRRKHSHGSDRCSSSRTRGLSSVCANLRAVSFMASCCSVGVKSIMCLSSMIRCGASRRKRDSETEPTQRAHTGGLHAQDFAQALFLEAYEDLS